MIFRFFKNLMGIALIVIQKCLNQIKHLKITVLVLKLILF